MTDTRLAAIAKRLSIPTTEELLDVYRDRSPIGDSDTSLYDLMFLARLFLLMCDDDVISDVRYVRETVATDL